MSDKKIAWEKWDDDLVEEEIVDEFYEINDSKEDEDLNLAMEALEFMSRIPKLVSTPAGMSQLYDKMSVLNQFECWMGHTNFDITKNVQRTLEKTEGVELLVVTSRYKFFVGIGKLFDFRSVRRDIENDLCVSKLKDELDNLETDEYTQETVELIRETICMDKYWAIFVRPSGEVKYASTNKEDDERYLRKLLKYEKDKEVSGGLIFQNEN
tara:strand:+ start:852 stop:1484 length:633 start_codon:yes stop_codon:yes gene_type:complete